jgi:large subunit ribosomal protein L24
VNTTMKIRQGDLVQVLSGKDRGKQGRVIQAMPRERRVVVENVNTVKRHTRPRPIKDSSRMGGQQVSPGGVIEKSAPIAISAVMVVCPVCNRATRVGYSIKEIKGEKVKTRVCRRADCGQEIDRGERK